MAKKEITVDVIDTTNNKVSDVKLDANVFGVDVNETAIYNAVKLYMANCRQATAKTKTRAEVSGGGKKPWRQKGTGRARAGSTRSPIWVGGGTVFGPKGVQNFKLDQNRKEHALALHSALTKKVNNGLVVLNEIKTDSKTKSVSNILKTLKLSGKTLIVTKELDNNLSLAVSNLAKVALIDVKHISVYDVMDAKNVVITLDALKEVK